MSDRTLEQLTVEAFFEHIALYPDTRFDFVDGEMVEVSPKPIHGYIQAKLAAIFDNWLNHHAMGYVYTEVLHILNGEKLIPDVSINREKAKDHAYFETPPLLAVEIRSDSQSRAAQRRKARAYIACGTPVVLLVMPDEHVELFTTTADAPIIYLPGDVITDLPGLPELRVDTTKLFD